MTERIQKILSSYGVASRRKAEEMILAGRVYCNGKQCVLGETADPDVDEILVDNKPPPKLEQRCYIMLNKPRGFVTTLSDEKGRKNVAQLVADCRQRVFPIGRLDMDSEGLLLLTNDGDFANCVMHPKHEIQKTYRGTVLEYEETKLQKLQLPVVLDGYQIKPPKIELESQNGNKAKILVTIHEGRNRQVRRMCAMAGLTVMRLERISEGKLQLGNLPKGKWRYLTEEEIERLK